MENTIKLLNSFLADNFVTLMKVWQFHWNVIGPSFGSYHEDFKELYETQQDRVDSVAERIRSLGGTPLHSLNEMLQHNTINESESELSPAEMWAELHKTWLSLIVEARSIHENIDKSDLGTANFLEDLIETMEKEDWMISMRLE